MEAIARVLTVGVRDGAVLGRWYGGHGDGAVAIGSALGAACGWALARVTARRGQPCVSVQRLTRDAEA